MSDWDEVITDWEVKDENARSRPSCEEEWDTC